MLLLHTCYIFYTSSAHTHTQHMYTQRGRVISWYLKFQDLEYKYYELFAFQDANI